MPATKRSRAYYDVRDALALPGCPVCRLRAAAAERMLDGILYEKVNDYGLRARINKARGFCAEHAWQLDRPGAALGTAIIYRDVLNELLRALEGARYVRRPFSVARMRETLDEDRPRAASAGIVAALSPQAACPVCARLAEARSAHLAALTQHLLGEDGLLEAYARSDGLCLPHFRQALARIQDADTFTSLVEAQAGIWRRLTGALDEAVRKSDYRFQDEPLSEEEGTAWLRALAALSGEHPPRSRR